jgi:anti-sigma regulatory factor (Ser/Thr protein kinase)
VLSCACPDPGGVSVSTCMSISEQWGSWLPAMRGRPYGAGVHPQQVTLPGIASSVPPARHFVERTLESWDLPQVSWTAALVVSELAANAALHAGTDFTVRLAVAGDRVRLEVRDRSLSLPRQRRHSAEATTGRGLRLVADLSTDWGVLQGREGKTVWVEMATDVGDGTDDDRVDVDALLDAFSDDGSPGDVGAPDATGTARVLAEAA